MTPALSSYIERREPSAIRMAQIAFSARPDRDEVQVINAAVGNVSLPMHPAMQRRMRALGAEGSPFAAGVVRYTPTAGTDEAQRAFLNIIASTGADTADLRCLVTDGASLAMELMIVAVCGPGSAQPLLVLDPVYTNYMDLARRVGVEIASVRRELGETGTFSMPTIAELEAAIVAQRPRALLIIPADNPTGQYLRQETIAEIGRLCVAHGIWLVSDECYRQLHLFGGEPSSIWRLTEADVPGITGHRISIESASKVFNACGLRVGALVTDRPDLHQRLVAEYTANLCSNAIGQYIFGALADESHAALRGWYESARDVYATTMHEVSAGLKAELPGVIVSVPESSLYAVVDLRNLVGRDFDAVDFVHYCATRGRVVVDGSARTVLVAPMAAFYGRRSASDPSHKQMRLAFVESHAQMRLLPRVFAGLLAAYLSEKTEAQRRHSQQP